MKKVLIVVGIVVIIAAVVLCLFAYNGREQTLEDILPMELGGEVLLRTTGADSLNINLSPEQIQQLQDVMSQAAYKKVGVADGMGTPENYVNLICNHQDRFVEIMFSTQKGGRILVNDMDSGKESPVYEIQPSGEKIEALLRSWLEAAAE